MEQGKGERLPQGIAASLVDRRAFLIAYFNGQALVPLTVLEDLINVAFHPVVTVEELRGVLGSTDRVERFEQFRQEGR